MPTLQAYTTIVGADEILGRYGVPAEWAAADTDTKTRWLNLGTRYVDDIYGPRAKGVKATADQLPLWPRTDVYAHSFLVVYLEENPQAPDAVKIASVLAASKAAQGIDLFPTSTGSSGAVKRQRSEVGPLKTETEWLSGSTPSAPPKLFDVDALLKASDLFEFGGYEIPRS